MAILWSSFFLFRDCSFEVDLWKTIKVGHKVLIPKFLALGIYLFQPQRIAFIDGQRSLFTRNSILFFFKILLYHYCFFLFFINDLLSVTSTPITFMQTIPLFLGKFAWLNHKLLAPGWWPWSNGPFWFIFNFSFSFWDRSLVHNMHGN